MKPIQLMLDSHINGKTIANLEAGGLVEAYVYEDLDLLPRDTEDGEIVERLVHEGIFMLMTKEINFDRQSGALWKQIDGFAVIRIRNKLAELLQEKAHEEADQALLKQVIVYLQRIDLHRQKNNDNRHYSLFLVNPKGNQRELRCKTIGSDGEYL